ncbi:SDR family NAD(P)-dependent oxidoreductase [Sphingobacterium thalpophilum]|uniref:SDR family NAD(P)-dependent oxidoreductase n=1 Tax=Sphingobacterium thalpophilum TaxID=259 RepID=UPI003C786704
MLQQNKIGLNETVDGKRIALITGANRSIGLQVAKELAQQGFVVLVGSRKLENARKAIAEIGDNAYPIAIDVTDQISINKAAGDIRQEFGRLDVLVNNAAIANISKPDTSVEGNLVEGLTVNASLDEMRAVWETNVFGVLAVTQAFLPLLLEAPKGRIVNVSSGLASLTLNSDPNFTFRKGFGAVYGASKTALNAITLALSIDLENTNISVEAASPGYTATAMNNFQGTDSIEEGSKNIVRAALGQNDPSSLFTGSHGPYPW